jgi:hypothetical protein
MKLHDLVTLKKRLCEYYNIDRSVQELSTVRDHLSNLDRDLDARYSEYLQKNVQTFSDVMIKLQHQHGTLGNLIAEIDTHIEHLTHELFSEGYDSELRFDMTNHQVRLLRSGNLPDAARALVIDRIRNYADWHYPGLELGCRTGEWTQYLVASDPLYIVDLDQKFLDITAEQFNELYQQRLRKYVIKMLPLTTEKNLAILPQEQFGFIFSWEYFNYLALGTARYYLEQCACLLRPGGIMLFGYNDGETPNGAAYAENRAQSYLPKSVLVKTCNEVGLEVINSESFDHGVVNWLEVRRPGTLHTIKTHQALGEIRRL